MKVGIAADEYYPFYEMIANKNGDIWVSDEFFKKYNTIMNKFENLQAELQKLVIRYRGEE